MSKNFVRKTSNNKNQINLSQKAKTQINTSFQSDTIKFNQFQVVWAKISGYPWWPALVTQLSDQKNTLAGKHPLKKKLKNLISDCSTPWDYRVDFIADETHAYLKKNYLLKFRQNRDRLVTEGFTIARRKARYFEAAINEADQIHQAMEASKGQVLNLNKIQNEEESESEQINQNQNDENQQESVQFIQQEGKQSRNNLEQSSEQKQLQNYIKFELDQNLNQNLNESIGSSFGEGKHPLEDLTHVLSNQMSDNINISSKFLKNKESPQTKPQKNNSQIKNMNVPILNRETLVNNLLEKYQLDVIPDLLTKFKELKKDSNIRKKQLKQKTNSYLSNNILESDSFNDENNADLQINGKKIKGSLSSKINVALKRGRKPNIKIIHKSELHDITFIKKLKETDISQNKRLGLYKLCKKNTARKIFSICKYKIKSHINQKKAEYNNNSMEQGQNLLNQLKNFSFKISDSYFNIQNDRENTLGNLYRSINECMNFISVFKQVKWIWMKKNCQQIFGSERYLYLENLRKKFDDFGIKDVYQHQHQHFSTEELCKVDESQKTNFITPSNEISSLMEQQHAIYDENQQNKIIEI